MEETTSVTLPEQLTIACDTGRDRDSGTKPRVTVRAATPRFWMNTSFILRFHEACSPPRYYHYERSHFVAVSTTSTRDCPGN
jgi:hypothetical protein